MKTLAAAVAIAVAVLAPALARADGSPIKHVVIVLQENRTFENIFHGYPGAQTVDAGYDSAGNRIPLVATHLMVPYDPRHHYEDWIADFAGGAMSGFDKAHFSRAGAPPNFAYSYAMRSDVQPYWDLAAEGALADAFFDDHRSGSFAGHQFTIAGASGPIDGADPDYYAAENPSGGQTCDDKGTGKAINIRTGAEDKIYTTCLDYQTLADRIVAKHHTWRYYVEASRMTSSYVSGYAVVKHIRNDPEQWKNVVSPAAAVLDDARNGTLADVSWVIGKYVDSDHAGQDVPSSNGPNWVASVFNAVGEGPEWNSSVVVLLYDDWGGWYDEVPPKVQFNAFEPGFRLPFVAVSAYARRGYVSHATHYTGSLLHFIETAFGLDSLGTSDARSDDLADLFDYTQAPLPYVPIKPIPAPAAAALLPDFIPPWLDPD
jgi:phospholipase C